MTRHAPAVISLTLLSAFIGVSLPSPSHNGIAAEIAGLVFLLSMFYAFMELFWDARVCRHHLKSALTFVFLCFFCFTPFHLLTGVQWVDGPIVSGVLTGWLLTVAAWSLYVGGSKDEEIRMKEEPF